jgi:hypothetical protein
MPSWHHLHPLYQYGSRYFAAIMATDAVLSTATVIGVMVIVPQFALTIALCALAAILPDFFWLYYYTHGRPQTWFFKFHTKIQWFERPPGLFVEASYLVFISTIIIAVK